MGTGMMMSRVTKIWCDVQNPPVAEQEQTPLTLSSEEHLVQAALSLCKVQAPLPLCKVQALLSLCKPHTFAPGRHHQRCKRTKIHARSH